MSELLEIALLGNPILKRTASPVEKIIDSDRDLVKLIDSLIATMMSAKGVGIAAPQVSQSYRLFIVASHPNQRYPHAPKMPPTAMLNPKIISHGEEIVKDWEGCLSVPNLRGLVPRFREIEVEYFTRSGKLERQILTDFIARIFQHELDHLNGMVFLDRLESEADLYSEEEYQNIIQG